MGYYFYYYCHHNHNNNHHKAIILEPRVTIASQMFSIVLFCLASCPVCYWCLLFYSAEPLLRIGVEGLQRTFHLWQPRVIALTSFHSIPLFFISVSLLPKPVGVFLGVPTLCTSLPAHHVLSSFILTTCPDHIKCASCFFTSLMGIIPNPIIIVWVLILSLLIFHSIFRNYFISLASNWLLH